MGPPKPKPYRVKFEEIKKRENTFECRWNSAEGHYYYFNPWTGETILNAESETLDRNYSMFAPPEKESEISRTAYTVELLPAIYASRTWGRRKFIGWNGDREAAATRIQADARGHFARQAHRAYLKTRYYTILCQFTHYYYFFDTHNPKRDTKWYKPFLATPALIEPFKAFDPTDNMPNPGDKYCFRGYYKGPFLRQSTLGKGQGTTERAPQDAFFIVDERRPSALRTNEEINLELYPIGTVVYWMEDLNLQTLHIDDYTAARASCVGNDWPRLYAFLKDNWSRPLARIYSWHSFAKMFVPLENKLLSAEARDMLNLLQECVEDAERKFSLTEKVFIANALFNMLSYLPCRREYFDASAYVFEQGEERQAAVDKWVMSRCTRFNRYMRFIPTEEVKSSVKGSKDFFTMRVPVQRHMELIEGCLEILGLLAQDSEQREPLASGVSESVFYALKVCAENATLTMAGLRLLYNLTYRCESGQETVLYNDTLNTLKRARMNHSADPQVMQQARRLELALRKNGHRGNVEKLMTMEFNNEKIPRKFLQTSFTQREYPEDWKFALEIAEDERIAAEERERVELAEIAREEAAEESARRERNKKERHAGSGSVSGSVSKGSASASVAGAKDEEAKGPDLNELPGGQEEDLLAALDKLQAGLQGLREDHKREEDKAVEVMEQELRSVASSKGSVAGSGAQSKQRGPRAGDAKAGSAKASERKHARFEDDDAGSVTSDVTFLDDMGPEGFSLGSPITSPRGGRRSP